MANTTVYPYGTGGTLPSSIGIINDAYTGGSDKALSAEVGKNLNEEINKFTTINIGGYTLNDAFITNQNTWNTSGTYKCKFVRVTPGERYVLQANLSNYSSFTVLTEVNYSTSSTPSYATGWGKVNVAAGKYREFTIPEGGRYIYMAITSDVDLTPNMLSRLTGPVYRDVMQYSLNLDSYPFVWAYPAATGKWTSENPNYKYYGIFIPCKGGQGFYITSNYYIQYTFLKTANHENQTDVDYATGMSGAPVNTNSTTASISAPSDARYLYLVASYDGFVSNNILPKSVKTEGTTVEQIASTVVSASSGEGEGIPAGITKFNYEGKQIKIGDLHHVGYEVIENAITSVGCQGGACYGDFLFLFAAYNTTCWIYNLADKQLLQTITLPVASRGFVTSCHCNTVNFGTEKYASNDPFPLIYVSTGYASDGDSGALVYRIVATTSDNTTTYSLSLVQTLKLPGTGWTEFVVGDDGDCYLCYTSTRTIYHMKMPTLSQGDLTFDLSEALNVYKFTPQPDWFNGSRNQNRIYYRGKIYVLSGVPTSEKTLLIVLDLATQTRESIIDLGALGISGEPEANFIWNNHLCFVRNNNPDLIKFYFD